MTYLIYVKNFDVSQLQRHHREQRTITLYWEIGNKLEFLSTTYMYDVSSIYFNFTLISYIYICNSFLLHNTVTSNAYLSPHRYLLLRNSIEARGDKAKFQHFVAFLTFFLKSGMVIDHKCKNK
jgi:hypothetical protein